MDENTVDDRTTARDSACTCCGRREVRERLQVTGPGVPESVVVCPYCDLQPAELQGWLAER